MDWNSETIARLGEAVAARWVRFCTERNTDRRNLSELWTNHLLLLDIVVVRPPARKKRTAHSELILSRLVEIINNSNKRVSDALCIHNPDRPGQFLLVPRELAAKILAIGMP